MTDPPVVRSKVNPASRLEGDATPINDTRWCDKHVCAAWLVGGYRSQRRACFLAHLSINWIARYWIIFTA